MELRELIEALEKATGPSRELDLELWWWCKASHSGQPMESDYKAHNLKMDDAPRYTSSLEAAITLVPEAANCWGVDMSPHSADAFVSRNYVKDDEGGHWLYEAEHPTSTAIALTIACLKVLESERG